MGKYDRVIRDLPLMPVERSERQERIDALKIELFKHPDVAGVPGMMFTPAELADAYIKLRRRKDELEEQLSALQLRIDAAEQLIPELWEAEDIQSLKLADGASVAVQPTPYAGVEDKESFRQWCLEQGLEREMHLAWASTNALMKERLLNGDTVACVACAGEGKNDAAEDGLCSSCKGTGVQVAPGVKIFNKRTVVLRGR